MTLTAASQSAPKQKITFFEDFALAGAAAVISKTAAAPIERVKLLVQNQDEMIKAGRLAEPYKGVIDCVKKTYSSEGFIPFWRGNLANCIRYFPTQALNFAFKDQIKALFKPKKSDPYMVNFSKNIASGGCAGSLSLCFVYSLDYCRTRLANDAKSAGKVRLSYSCLKFLSRLETEVPCAQDLVYFHSKNLNLFFFENKFN